MGKVNTVCIASDCFCPDAGGVENHIMAVAQCLREMGKRVVVLTRYRGERVGVRYMLNGVKVYYLPLPPMPDVFSSGRVTLPTMTSFFPLFRDIVLREGVDMVHAHQAFSTLGYECLLFSQVLGIRTAFTDHSLFGFEDGSALMMNRIMEMLVSNADAIFCVSRVGRENTVLRGRLPAAKVSVMPNAVDATAFRPSPLPAQQERIVVVAIGRLVLRKGVDLLARIIPIVCARLPHVDFVIGGDGPRRVVVEEMRDRYNLHERVRLLGKVEHHDVPATIRSGHIFLNCSFTEAFCIAVLEAVSCGRVVVTTDVGGVAEVLPPTFAYYSQPDPEEMAAVLVEVVEKEKYKVDVDALHGFVASSYSWRRSTADMVDVYEKVCEDMPKRWKDKANIMAGYGPIIGFIFILAFSLLSLLSLLLSHLRPAMEVGRSIDIAEERWIEKRGKGKVGGGTATT
uniref:Phosphatidylinositol N-acetylglucosaminyltransferase n=1 Tax=Palpitomonas bilix TaxID=652834 RepID=A0A7S3G7T8_9EUKA|mmetsp:Transcript_33965/g.87207  ORF Transcript_33965/g.87207 Transcript_33965/m.87207 type:complete len:454 (+) Transcript_33965:150-1511(+)